MVRQFTIGFDPQRGGTMPFTEGKIGDFVGNGVIDRLYLFGQPTLPPGAVDDRYYRQTADFDEGQQRSEQFGMPSFRIRIDNKTVGRFSREVVSVCSQGLDPARIAAFENAMQHVSAREDLEDLAVTMAQLLARPPALGFPIDPPIAFLRNSDLRVEDLHPGQRLFLVGRMDVGHRW